MGLSEGPKEQVWQALIDLQRKGGGGSWLRGSI